MRQLTIIPGVVGVGYEGRTAEEVISGLANHGVDVVVDVRLNPISRKAGLSKTALRQGLADAGIEYLHLRQLGNPKSNRAGFSGTTEEVDTAVEFYRQLLDRGEARESLDLIRERSQTQRLALLCFEADECRCHRQVILDRLSDLAATTT